MGFVQTLLYCFMATSLLPRVALQNCRDPVFIEMSLQERLYQAEIIVYGQDQLSFSPCPQEEDSCKTTPRNEREYSNFMVYCVVKNNGPPIPANMTIYPKTFGDPCTETRFEQGVEGWVYLVTLSYKDGKYYWDEINGMSALTTIYIVDNDEKLKRAGNVCNLPPASLPEGYSEVKYCPATLNRTRDENTCFQGCERGWKPIGKSCYWFSDTNEPKTRNEAAISCLLQDSNLFAIESQEEESWLTDVFTNHVDTEWWTSGVYNGTKWIWQDGLTDPEVTFTTWRPSEPSGPRGIEDYIVILYQKSRWGWSDARGEKRLPYVCEKARGEHPPLNLKKCTSSGSRSDQCLRALVKIMLNDTFLQPPPSSNFHQCHGKTAYDDINCLRSPRGNISLVDLLFARTYYNPYVARKELDVAFATVPGQLRVCGKKYSWPRTRLIRPRLGEEDVYDSWFFQEGTSFRASWEPESDTLYTLLILDLDLWSVHGAWMNIAGGNLTSGQVVQEYVPLAVATPDIPGTYAFLLFKQKSPALLTENIARMLTHSYTRREDFNLTTISHELGLGDLVGINILRVASDPYSSWFFQNVGFTNHCPEHLQNAYGNLRAPPLPLKETLSLVLNVEFKTGDEEWSMCCKRFSIDGSTQRLDPYGMTLNLLPTQDTRVAPSINITKGNVRLDGLDRQQVFKDEWYSLMMIDAGTVSNRLTSKDTKFPLHWLIANIPDGTVSKGDTIVEYKVPAPDPAQKSEHLYMIYIFKQKQLLENVAIEKFSEEDCTTLIRCRLELTEFLEYHGMSLAGANWFVTSPDTYTLKTLINDELMSPADACLSQFPSTRTFGPLVVCETPKPVQPTVRPVISGHGLFEANKILTYLLICVVLCHAWT